MKRLSEAWLKALSGLFINFSAAAAIGAGFIGVNVFTPKTASEFWALTFTVGIFLLLTVKIEKELAK